MNTVTAAPIDPQMSYENRAAAERDVQAYRELAGMARTWSLSDPAAAQEYRDAATEVRNRVAVLFWSLASALLVESIDANGVHHALRGTDAGELADAMRSLLTSQARVAGRLSEIPA